MAQIPDVTIDVAFDFSKPVRSESVPVLVDELELTEKELFDTRELYFEEVRLTKVLTDEIVELEHQNAALNDNFWTAVRIHHDRKAKLRNRIDELEAKEFVRKKNDGWIGVAIGAAFLLGGYVGFILGCAT